MIKNKRTILSILILANTIIIWFCIYKAWYNQYESELVSEYDWDIPYTIAIVLSIINLITIIYLFFTKKDKSHLVFMLITFIFGSPFAFIISTVYVNLFYMASISFIMDVEGTFDMAKSRNYFKSKNVLVLKKSSENSDTLISEIFRNGKVKSIYLIKKGNKTKVKLDEIKFQDQEMKTDFISY